jgi:hypothetical protein
MGRLSRRRGRIGAPAAGPAAAGPAAAGPAAAVGREGVEGGLGFPRGVPAVPDAVLTEIVDEVFLPLVRGRRPAGGPTAPGP